MAASAAAALASCLKMKESNAATNPQNATSQKRTQKKEKEKETPPNKFHLKQEIATIKHLGERRRRYHYY